MEGYQIIHQGETKKLIHELKPTEALDPIVYGMLSNNQIEGLAPLHSLESDTGITLSYDITGTQPLTELFDGYIKKDGFLAILKAILRTALLTEEYLIPEQALLLDNKLIFFDMRKNELRMICTPAVERHTTTVKEYMDGILRRGRFAAGDGTAYIDQLLTLVRSDGADIEFILRCLPNLGTTRFAENLEQLREREADIRQSASIEARSRSEDRSTGGGLRIKPTPGREKSMPWTLDNGEIEKTHFMEVDRRTTQRNIGNEPVSAVKGSAGNTTFWGGQSFGTPTGGARPTTFLSQPVGEDVATIKPTPNRDIPRRHAYILRLRTSERIELSKPIFRIGQEKDCVEYCVEDNAAISRTHAKIISRNNQYYILDTKSTNHTFVNGVMIPSEEEVLIEHGARFRLANEPFAFVIEED